MALKDKTEFLDDLNLVKKKAIANLGASMDKKLMQRYDTMITLTERYGKELRGEYSRFIQNVMNSAQMRETDKGIRLSVPGARTLASQFTNAMQAQAEKFFPIAIDAGRNFIEGYVKAARVQEAQDKQKKLLTSMLLWNENYLEDSLKQDIIGKLDFVTGEIYESRKSAQSRLADGLSTFVTRVDMYAGAAWTVSEKAVKEFGGEAGLIVHWIGADDKNTCEGCADAFEGNPYLMSEAPEPGSFECLGNCRHALQVVGVRDEGGEEEE